MSSLEYRQHMAKVPTSVVVAAGLKGGEPIGMIVGTFTSVSLDPPLVGFLGDLGSRTLPALLDAGRISFSVLARDAFPRVTDALRRPAAQRFEGLDWTPSGNGLPRLSPAVLHVEGPVASTGQAGDHMIVRVVPEVIDVGDGDSPLVFWGGQMMGIGDVTISPIWQLGQVDQQPRR